jgi:hypothetical protein
MELAMSGRRWSLLKAMAALIAVALVVVVAPAFGTDRVTVDIGVLHLHLDADGDSLRFDPTSGAPSLNQGLGVAGQCRLTSSGPDSLVTFSATSANPTRNPYPGLKDHRIGVGQTGEGNGEPCARINKDLGQVLTMQLTGALAGNRVVTYAEIVLGFKFNGEARLGLYLDGALVQTVTIPCSGSDCGPDSGAADNKRVILDHDPSTAPNAPAGWPADSAFQTPLFDEIRLEANTPSNGAVSLEDGLAGTARGPLGTDLNTSDSLFVIAEVFDGEIDCGDTVSETQGAVVGVITRFENTDGGVCTPKPYDLDVVGDTVSFIAPGTQSGAFEAVITFSPDPAKNTLNQVEQGIEYDPENDGTFVPMLWCEGDPFLNPPTPGSLDPSVVPEGETACIVSSTTEVFDSDETQTTWQVVFLEDIGFRKG